MSTQSIFAEPKGDIHTLKTRPRNSESQRKDRNNIEVGPKLFAVLEYFVREDATQHAIPVRDMTVALPFARTTLHRILNTLERIGYIEKAAEKSHYRLGHKFYELTEPATHYRRLLSVAKAVMVDLMVRFSETVNLGVLDEHQVSYIDVIESPSSLRTAANAGDRNPLHSTSLGKALLAFLPDDEVEVILEKNPMVKMTSKTITQRKHLIEHLASVREQGVAFDLEENVEGVTCVASPIFDQRGRVVAAISVSGPSTRMEAKILALREAIQGAGTKISRLIGLRSEMRDGAKNKRQGSRKKVATLSLDEDRVSASASLSKSKAS